MMKPYSELALNRAACDWITLTSWHEDAFYGLIERPDEAKKVQRLNYSGLQEGKVFVGVGEQNGYMHKMMQVSGKDAALWLPALLHLPDCECTHLDLQITCEWEDNDIFAIVERLRDRRLCDFRTSTEGDTAYVNSRLSDLYIRFYHKDRKTVRFEVAYKKPYARAMWETLQRESVINEDALVEEKIKEWLMWELWKLQDGILMGVFADALGKSPVKPPKYVPAPENNTERWLRKIVAPALKKYANSHDRDEYLLAHLMNIIIGEIK